MDPTSRSLFLQGASLSVGYGDREVLSNVDFTLEPGKLTVLLGPNGCGKSTLLKTLARTIAPNQGRVLLNGEDIHRKPTRTVARKLGILPQSPNAPDGLTVRELVALGRFPYQSLLRQWSREDQHAVDSAMAEVQVAEFADRAVDTLSGGQRQRCWIAMVLAQDTGLVLLDEPTTFLDLKVQVGLLELLVAMTHKSGRTLLVVLHDLNLAAAYADTLVMMKEGRILHRGTPFTAFTGENLKEVFDLDARIVTDPDTGRPVCIPKRLQAPAIPPSPETAVVPQ